MHNSAVALGSLSHLFHSRRSSRPPMALSALACLLPSADALLATPTVQLQARGRTMPVKMVDPKGWPQYKKTQWESFEEGALQPSAQTARHDTGHERHPDAINRRAECVAAPSQETTTFSSRAQSHSSAAAPQQLAPAAGIVGIVAGC